MGGNGRRGKSRPVAFDRISGSGGGPGDVPPECTPKDDTGSADDMWRRMKVTEQLLPEEHTGFADHRALESAPDYGYGGG